MPARFLLPVRAMSCAAVVQALAAAPAAASPDRLGGGEPLDVSLARIVAAHVICIIIAFLAALLVRQRGDRIEMPALFAQLPRRQVGQITILVEHLAVCRFD